MRLSQHNFSEGNRSIEFKQAIRGCCPEFSQSWNDIFSIILVHLVKEIGILGPVFLHNMFPFEGYFAVLKKYVRNRARPEGSIAKGYITEEVIEFCVDYVEKLCPIGIPVSCQEGRWLERAHLEENQ